MRVRSTVNVALLQEAQVVPSTQLLDCIISHPVKAFVPASVKGHIFCMPAVTCGYLDGLNKDLRDLTYYQNLFVSHTDQPVDICLDCVSIQQAFGVDVTY